MEICYPRRPREVRSEPDIMSITLYGIRSCDTVRKARRWLDEHGIGYAYHDLREDGLEDTVLGSWIGAQGWEQVINRRSATWKALPATERERMDAAGARRAALAAPTLIKRPVLVTGDTVEFGFDPARYAELTA